MVHRSQLRLGTRASALARWQAEWVAARLTALGIEVQLVLITTEGDVQGGSLGQIGGQGLFTKCLQQALLENQIDLAVHSLKDLPTEHVPGLTLAAVPERESASDVLVNNRARSIDELPAGATIGTGSMRRKAQLLHRRPDLRPHDIRGNVDTRLRKLDAGQFDALVLAEAGLKRLGLEDRITQVIPHSVMLPAVGQGALGLEARADDHETQARVTRLDHVPSRNAVLAERAMLAELRAGCLAPVGAFANVTGDTLHLAAAVLSRDGVRRVFASANGAAAQPEAVGRAAALDLLNQGAALLIAQSRQQP
jgi:hydroxymethylbilane synthase